MGRIEELEEVINMANELIASQDHIINSQEASLKQGKKVIEKQDKIISNSNDIIKLLKLRISGLEEIVERQENLLSCLKDRPCDVCSHRKEHGCEKWTCVFEGDKR